MLPCIEAAAFVTTTPPIPPELLEHLEDAVVLADASRTILWASRRTAELFAWSHPELIGQKLDATVASELGLVTFTPDDLDWDEEVRLAIELAKGRDTREPATEATE